MTLVLQMSLLRLCCRTLDGSSVFVRDFITGSLTVHGNLHVILSFCLRYLKRVEKCKKIKIAGPPQKL